MSHQRIRCSLFHSFVVLALSTLGAAAQASTLIDDFSTNQSALTLTYPPAGTSASSSTSGSGILGGERDLQINLTSGVIAGNTLTGVVSSGFLSYSQDATIGGSATIQWDGTDGSATLNPTGLGGVDLTAGGSQNGILISTFFDDLPLPVTLTVYTNATDYSSVTVSLPGLIFSSTPYFVPFTAFTPSGGGALFANVGAIRMTAGSTVTAPDLVIDYVQADADINAVTSAALVNDVNGDNVINPGDTVRVTVVVSNPSDGFGAAEQSVLATVPIPAGAVLVANSVTTTQGTVASGNSPSDASVVLSVGTISDGGSVTATFDVVLQTPASLPVTPLSVQATLESQTLLHLLSNDSTTGSGPTPIGPTFTSPATLSASQTVSTSGVSGSNAVYTVVISNTSTSAQFDNPGDEFTETFPAGVMVQTVSATSGTASAAGNGVSWDGSVPGNGSVTLTVVTSIAASPGQAVSAQGTVNYDAAGNGSNSASALSDDPGVAGSADPTVFTVLTATNVSATQTVAGTFHPGQTVTYTVVLNNSGQVAQPDNAGDEFSDTVPGQLTLLAANATTGNAAVSGNVVHWNGGIPAGGSVTITYTATINSGTVGQVVSNQGTASYDADGNGSNESTTATDDPALPGIVDPTVFSVTAAPVTVVAQIPALGPWSLLLLCLLLVVLATSQSRRLAVKLVAKRRG